MTFLNRKELLELVERLTDPEPCEYDHHDYCQAHGLHEKPCPHEVARGLLRLQRWEELTQ